MKFTSILLNLALTATAMAAAIDIKGNADLAKRECQLISLPGKPGVACVPAGCQGLTAYACCSEKWNQATAICK